MYGERNMRKNLMSIIELTNRYNHVINASGIDDFLSKTDASGKPIDQHPEKRMKAAWRSFMDKRMEELKKEYPKMKRSQYIQMMSKEVIIDLTSVERS